MPRNTFEDDIHSALGSIQACAYAIKLCDNAVEHRKIGVALRKVSKCARLVRDCKRLIDSRQYRSTNSRATAWEIRAVMGMDQKINVPSTMSGRVNPDGSIDVYDKAKGNGEAGHVGHASKQDVDAKYAEFLGQPYNGHIPKNYNPRGGNSGVTILNGAKRIINQFANGKRLQVGNSGAGVFVPAGGYPEDKSLSSRVLSKIGRILRLTAEISVILGAINFTGAGDNLAEGAKQIGRFKNWIVETARKIKNKITGRH